MKCCFLASVFMKNDEQALWLLGIPGWPGSGLGQCCADHRD